MAYLNKQERDKLANDLKDKTIQQIRGYVNRKDDKTRLAFFRNAHVSGKWMTSYVLESFGIRVNIYETIREQPQNGRKRRKFIIDQIEVKPTADNRL